MKPVTIDKPISELKPIEVKCSDTKCEEGFHYFTSKVPGKGKKVGDCKKCGDDSVDWDRIYKRDLNDIQYTFDSLKKELLRHVCWTNPIDETILNKSKIRGKVEVLNRAKEIISKKIGHPIKTHFDRMCTPKKGPEIIHYAQHATGTCCRICLERWHNIPQHGHLTDAEINYCVKLIELFLNDRIPGLTDEGQPLNTK